MFEISARARELLGRLQGFMDEQVLPLEPDWYQHLSDPAARGTAFAPLQGLQQRARAQGLWNLFLADTRYGAGLSHLEYAPLAEAMGRSLLAPAVFNATQPDCSSIDLLALYGNDAQRERWLRPLLAAELRAALAVSEGTVGSSDPANLVTTLAKRPEDTDWERIVALYDALAALIPSPVIELNRAVAISRAFGAQAGLDLVDTLQSEPTLARYHLLPAVRADLLAQLGRAEEARLGAHPDHREARGGDRRARG